jgi:aminobenzoyl-glutamate utilization protein A
MNFKIIELAKTLQQQAIARRRDFHKYPETAWTEFRTASIVAETLTDLGYEVLTGDTVVDGQAMMGVPAANELIEQMHRALNQGANPAWVEKMHYGKTGVVGIMHFKRPGPTVALRFDMDANDLSEALNKEHRPYRDGFASVNRNVMHACGHDGHTTVGLTVAEIISELADNLAGTIKLIFQPGEEGVRGAKSMAATGIVDDVDFLIGMHLGTSLGELGQVSYKTDGFFATSKIDADFTGIPAHAGAKPETGRNALLAAANALINLQAISRHSQGTSRVNVGVLQGGSGRNVIPANASIKLEIRGSNSEVNEYMYQEAIRIIDAAAAMQGVTVVTKLMGSAAAGKNDEELAERVKEVAKELGLFKKIMSANSGGGSEDCSYFMERVQQHGGQAIYTLIGTELAAGHHDSRFDFNEAALELAAIFLTSTAVKLLDCSHTE